MNTTRPLLQAMILSAAITASLMCNVVPMVLTMNTSFSMPIGVYLRVPMGTLQEGAMLELDNPRPDLADVPRIFKYLVADLGEQGLWVEGGSTDSLDSTVFGPVPRSSVRRRFVPVVAMAQRHVRKEVVDERFVISV